MTEPSQAMAPQSAGRAGEGLRRIGVVVGREWSWPPAFVEEVNRRDAGVVADMPRFDITLQHVPLGYHVLIDRISHEIPFYRALMKKAAIEGAVVINNPFMWSADDKFFGTCLLDQMGIAQPRTVLLPNRGTNPGGLPMSNGGRQVSWSDVGDWVGYPAILKDAHGGGGRSVFRVDSSAELEARYNETGGMTMILQEFIVWEQYVRCICLGGNKILPIRYDPDAKVYHVDHEHLTPELGSTVVDWATKINTALGYDMNTVEFAIRGGVPYAIDFMNPAPDFDVYSLTPTYFEWAVTTMADLAIERALQTELELVADPTDPPAVRWNRLLAGTATQHALPAGRQPL